MMDSVNIIPCNGFIYILTTQALGSSKRLVVRIMIIHSSFPLLELSAKHTMFAVFAVLELATMMLELAMFAVLELATMGHTISIAATMRIAAVSAVSTMRAMGKLVSAICSGSGCSTPCKHCPHSAMSATMRS